MSEGPDARPAGETGILTTSAPTATPVGVAFVAEGQIPPAPPPPGQTGPLRWVRENLFPDVLNTVLTLASVAFLVWVLPGLYQWAIGHAVWAADSLDQCRNLMDERFGEGTRGACWAVVGERLGQFMYGFYPDGERWRPTLAFGLLFVAMAPVLFSGLPLRTPLFALTFAYPAIAYFLIWGGSVWGPILVLASPLLAYLAWRLLAALLEGPLGEELAGVFALLGGAAALVAWLAVGVATVDEALTRSVADTRIPDRVAELTATANDAGATEDEREAAREERAGLLSLDEQRAELASLRRELEALGSQPLTGPDPDAAADEGTRRLREVEGALSWLIGGPQTIAAFVAAHANEASDVQADAYARLSAEDRALAEAYAALESQVTGEESRIWATYKELGRVGLEPVESSRLGGFLLTLVIGVTAISASLPIGVLLALGRRSGLIFIRMVSVVIIETIRGVPLITLLFVASTLLNYFLPPGTSFDIILRVLILATLFASAYIAEAVRGGLAALPKGQYEAADATGLTYWQSMRLVILPQALKIAIPSIVNIFIGLFKDTTLVSIIGLFDPLGIIQPILADSRWQGIYAEVYLFVAILFFFCCFGMSRYSMYLERKLKTDHR